LQGSTCIEHAAEKPFLTLHHLPIEPPGLKATGKFLRFVRHLTCAGYVALAAELFQLLGQRALAGGELLQLLSDRTPSRHRQEPDTLTSQTTLLLRQLRHALECFGQTRTRLRPRHLISGAEQLVSRGVELIHRTTGLLRRLPDIGGGGRDGFSGPAHLELGSTKSRCDLGRDQRILAAGLLHLFQNFLDPFLDSSLLCPGRRARLALSELILDSKLALGEAASLGQGLIHGVDDLPSPLLLQFPTSLLQLITYGVEGA
jgi:hypothetical protein